MLVSSVSSIKIGTGGKKCSSICTFLTDVLFGIVGKPGLRELRTEITSILQVGRSSVLGSIEVGLSAEQECCFPWVGGKC